MEKVGEALMTIAAIAAIIVGLFLISEGGKSYDRQHPRTPTPTTVNVSPVPTPTEELDDIVVRCRLVPNACPEKYIPGMGNHLTGQDKGTSQNNNRSNGSKWRR